MALRLSLSLANPSNLDFLTCFGPPPSPPPTGLHSRTPPPPSGPAQSATRVKDFLRTARCEPVQVSRQVDVCRPERQPAQPSRQAASRRSDRQASKPANAHYTTSPLEAGPMQPHGRWAINTKQYYVLITSRYRPPTNHTRSCQ